MELVNACTDLPFATRWHIRKVLGWIHPVDLDGIAFVRLVDKLPEPSIGDQTWHKRATEEGFSVEGLYVCRQGTHPAHLVLFIRDLYRAVPRVLQFSTVPTLLIGRSLAHEVGHHLVAKQGYIFEPNEKYQKFEYEEEMANRYAFSVLQRMYSRWHYRVGSWLSKRTAALHYVMATADWKEQKYAQAAECWYRAWLLDPDRQDAVDWFWRAKQASKDNAVHTATSPGSEVGHSDPTSIPMKVGQQVPKEARIIEFTGWMAVLT
jgi:hypothetical protein